MQWWTFIIVGGAFLLLQAFLVGLFFSLCSKLRQNVFPRIRTDVCICCGYPLGELTKGSCPECGVEIGWNAVNAELLRRKWALSGRPLPRSLRPAVVWFAVVGCVFSLQPPSAPIALRNQPYFVLLWLTGLVVVILQARGAWRASEEGRQLEGWLRLIGMAAVWLCWFVITVYE